MTEGAWLAILLFLALYVVLVAEWMHRALAALIAGVLAVGTNLLTPPEAIRALDWNTLALLFGLMLLVAVLEEAGLFTLIGAFARHLAGPSPWRLLWAFTVMTAIVSAFLPNVTVLMILAPALISAAEAMGIDPVPLLMVEVFASNLGGLATLIGDPPNILIGTAATLTFTDFFIHLAPLALGLLVILGIYARLTIRLPRRVTAVIGITAPAPPVRDLALLLAIFGLTVAAFIAQRWIGLPIGLIAVVGGLLSVVASGPDFEKTLRQLDWSTLIFFAGLFLVVGALTQQGVITRAAVWLVGMHMGRWMPLVILVGTALFSALLDNLPIVAAAIPLIHIVLHDHPQYGVAPWLALAAGAAIGGNATSFGATANVVAVGLANVRGYSLSFRRHLSMGVPITLLTLAAAVLWIVWGVRG